jgi:hypothetical protein
MITRIDRLAAASSRANCFMFICEPHLRSLSGIRAAVPELSPMTLKTLARAASRAGTVADTSRVQPAPATTFSASPIAEPTRVA